MYDNEYEERAYQWFTKVLEDGDLCYETIEPVCVILGEEWDKIEPEFVKRYIAEQNNLNKITTVIDEFENRR